MTLDASEAGGPRYVELAPHWRVIYRSECRVDVIVRKCKSRDSEAIAMLKCGDIAEQAGQQEDSGDGLLRMPIAVLVPAGNNNKENTRTVGWVTVDASKAGGPVYFEECERQDGIAWPVR